MRSSRSAVLSQSAGCIAMYCAMRGRPTEWFGRTPCASSELKISRSPASIGTLTMASPVVSGCIGIAVGRLRAAPTTRSPRTVRARTGTRRPPRPAVARLSTPCTPIGSGRSVVSTSQWMNPFGIALHLLRQVQVGAIDRHPQVLAIPDVDERVVDARVGARVPQVLVVVDLEHARVVQLDHRMIATLRRVPRRRIVRGPSRRTATAGPPAAPPCRQAPPA